MVDLAATLGNPSNVQKWSKLAQDAEVTQPQSSPQVPCRPKQRQRRLSDREVDELVSLFLAGERHKDIAIRFGINPNTVTQVLRRRGLAWERGLRPEQVDEAVRLYVDEGWPLARVGEVFSCSAGTVRRVLLEAGVKTRPRAW